MQENRFLKTYQDYKQENNRFACLKDDRPIIQRDAGRFECLRDNYNISSENRNNRFNCLRDDYNIHSENISNRNSRFACLIEDNKYNYNRSRCNTYPLDREYNYETKIKEPDKLIRPDRLAQPSRHIENNYYRSRGYSEDVRVVPVKKPEVSIDSTYHFPELNTTKIITPKKEMIVNNIIIPVKHTEVMTVISMDKSNKDNKGKLQIKDVYEDGSSINSPPKVIIKKPEYNSWASVLKPSEVIYHDVLLEKN
jgi:hypothetical protein